MSVGAEQEIDWKELDKQFDGGGNNGNGDDGGGGDEDNEPEEPENNEISAETILGLTGGLFVGYCAGGFAAGRYGNHKINDYIATHHITTTPSTRPAIENQVYEKAANNDTELGIMLIPTIAIAALGTAIGSKVGKRRRSR